MYCSDGRAWQEVSRKPRSCQCYKGCHRASNCEVPTPGLRETQFVIMKLILLSLLSLAAPLASASAIAVESDYIPAGASITPVRASLLSRVYSSLDKKKKDNWGNALEKDRKKITIRASKHDRDDISADFLWALKKANKGGLVHLEKGKKYVIGKKLNLKLNDVYLKLDGELKVSFTFQNALITIY